MVRWVCDYCEKELKGYPCYLEVPIDEEDAAQPTACPFELGAIAEWKEVEDE